MIEVYKKKKKNINENIYHLFVKTIDYKDSALIKIHNNEKHLIKMNIFKNYPINKNLFFLTKIN